LPLSANEFAVTGANEFANTFTGANEFANTVTGANEFANTVTGANEFANTFLLLIHPHIRYGFVVAH
jgi:hypothetical protein